MFFEAVGDVSRRKTLTGNESKTQSHRTRPMQVVQSHVNCDTTWHCPKIVTAFSWTSTNRYHASYGDCKWRRLYSTSFDSRGRRSVLFSRRSLSLLTVVLRCRCTCSPSNTFGRTGITKSRPKILCICVCCGSKFDREFEAWNGGVRRRSSGTAPCWNCHFQHELAKKRINMPGWSETGVGVWEGERTNMYVWCIAFLLTDGLTTPLVKEQEETRQEIESLRVTLDEEQRYRRQKIEYDAIAEKINTFSTRSELDAWVLSCVLQTKSSNISQLH